LSTRQSPRGAKFDRKCSPFGTEKHCLVGQTPTLGREAQSPLSARTIGGITVPDTPLVRDVTALIRDAEDDLLFDHCRRVFLFGATQGRRRGLQPDLELLHVSAMLHDIGLTEAYRTSPYSLGAAKAPAPLLCRPT
jgi:hypothetical protein